MPQSRRGQALSGAKMAFLPVEFAAGAISQAAKDLFTPSAYRRDFGGGPRPPGQDLNPALQNVILQQRQLPFAAQLASDIGIGGPLGGGRVVGNLLRRGIGAIPGPVRRTPGAVRQGVQATIRPPKPQSDIASESFLREFDAAVQRGAPPPTLPGGVPPQAGGPLDLWEPLRRLFRRLGR